MNSTDASGFHEHRDSENASGRSTARHRGTWTIVAAVAAGLVAWLIGETPPVWVAPKTLPFVATTGAKYDGATTETLQASVIATAVRLHGVFGAVLGLALGAAGGLGMGRRGLWGAPVGAILGLIAGVAASYAGIPVFFAHEAMRDDLTPSLLLHGGIWGAIGGAVAIGWGVGAAGGKGQTVRACLGGLIGAILGAVAFEFLGAAFFMGGETDKPISNALASRLLARLLVATMTAVGIVAASSAASRAKPGAGE